MITSDKRAIALLDWLKNETSLNAHSLVLASSDASFRRYFRATAPHSSYIIMDAPPDKEPIEPFIHVAALLKRSNVHVPTIYYKNLQQGFLVLDDFGSRCLLDVLTTDNADLYYGNALNELFKLQANTCIKNANLPDYNQALLTEELALFYDWFIQKLLGQTIPENRQQDLNTLLIDSALAQPQVCVHRDYHSRNLMVVDAKTIGVIDFQDAVIGAITYDLVSLLRDCYISWSEQKLNTWLTRYYQRLFDDKMLSVSFPTFKRWFDLMGLQRHMKAIGIFSRLHLRDHKSAYLNDIPRTMAYIEKISQNYPELEAFYHWLKQHILPTYQQKL